MSVRSGIAALLLILGSGCGPAPGVDVTKPEAFAHHAVLQPAAGGRLQQVTLPAALLAATQRRDGGDIRVFDARERLVGLALLNADAFGEPRGNVDLSVYPVLGEGETLKDSHLTIRVEDGDEAQAVTVDRSSSAAVRMRMPAVLLDTRALREPVGAIALRAEIPPGRPVALTLLTSANLKDWKPLAEKVLFRPSGDGPLLSGAEVPLDGADLQGRFVGISWIGSARVALSGASAITGNGAEAQRTAVLAAPLSLTNAHELQFTLPNSERLAALRLTPSQTDGILPIRLYGRGAGRDTWSLVAVTTLAADGRTNIIDLPAAAFASYKVEADRRTAGFSAPPKAELLFNRVDLLVALSGAPPYRVAIGQPAAPPNYLSLDEIVPAGGPRNLAGLPRATLVGAHLPMQGVALQGRDVEGQQDRRKPVLWMALLLGTLVLAYAAFRLLRAGNTANA